MRHLAAAALTLLCLSMFAHLIWLVKNYRPLSALDAEAAAKRQVERTDLTISFLCWTTALGALSASLYAAAAEKNTRQG